MVCRSNHESIKLVLQIVLDKPDLEVVDVRTPLYQIERCFLGTGERFEDGSHILM